MKTTPRYVIYREWIFLSAAVLFSVFLIMFNDSSFNDTLSSYGLDAYSLINYDYFSFREKSAMQKELADLKTKIMYFENNSEAVESVIEENYRLRSMLSIQERDSFEFVYARIAGISPGSTRTILLINAGREKGVGPGDAVITEAGVIGFIETAGESTSRVSLISGRTGKIAVRTEINRAYGILAPLNSETAAIEEIAKGVNVNIGENIFTADFSEVYPPDLLVGTVISVSDSSATINKKILLSFAQNMDTIEDVFVMRRTKKE
ncbi:MAG: rod shape-determining protein MreC [Candidatus Delongbacteria bacterium]